MSSSPSTIEALARWARLKKYRIEVTYGVYVFTPVEKAIFWTIFCFLFTTISFAAVLYTQRNVLLLLRYASSSFYVGGEGHIINNVVPNLFPRSGVPLGMAGSGITSVAETMSTAANSQIP
ncbi:uncharacterized protein F4812DRAFT_13852 [Daldinia caldariorum]|uniref:uncharacterized protein n=1 Tax=Daldinia caldariorum TaxID=326644 RepID=UPI002008D23D|nr:uncharacterized protein F4812DRAFT_13852 [Daldinia caldariorum]KAI1472471.1 hypothetical protein F4812DRAFT_13852 [Daldinia caldariorum]